MSKKNILYCINIKIIIHLQTIFLQKNINITQNLIK